MVAAGYKKGTVRFMGETKFAPGNNSYIMVFAMTSDEV